ncbi:hypothetical protein KDK82_0364 [Delftia sp. K82]|uniref:virulence factor TspB C-terminal domain-related protein n=1 Tax=Delftia sp. K82 TaxID=1472718 RepID=UPI000B491D39|nr:virulence factor TspB C-terminal domain-related protein [Delftia sp. K82]OWG16903.1 hypothetical protein KDK82_0364 [Delftia sp. K82]
MAYLRALVILAACAFSGACIAGYAQLAPPVGWSPTSVGGSAGTFNLGNAANGSSLVGNTVRTTASLNVGGRAISVPASMRFASNAPKFLAGRVGASLALGGSAALTGGLSVAAALLLPIAVEWWQQTEFEWDGNKWLQKKKVLNGFWRDTWGYGEYGTANAACNARLTGVYAEVLPSNPSLAYCYYGPGQVAGSVTRVGEEVVEVKVVPYEPKVREALETAPLPEKLPGIIPLDYPIDLPVINPSPAMQPQPLFVPTGNPVQNPNYDPSAAPGPNNSPYLQPGIRVVPSPAPGAPWQVDLQPINRPVDSPNPDPNPKPDPNPSDGDKPSEKDPGLCDMYPDILACKKLGDIEVKELPKKTIPLRIDKQNVGPENGSCPAPRQFEIMGQSMAFQWDLLCDFATGIRPILIGFAWLSAALAFVGLTRRGD